MAGVAGAKAATTTARVAVGGGVAEMPVGCGSRGGGGNQSG